MLLLFPFQVTLEGVTGTLDTFIVEPMCAFSAEYYICIHSLRECDEMLFHHEGGVEVGDVDAKAVRQGEGRREGGWVGGVNGGKG
eukprot:scaffold11545_cov90-Isochrysis_galbana.AAC.1